MSSLMNHKTVNDIAWRATSQLNSLYTCYLRNVSGNISKQVTKNNETYYSYSIQNRSYTSNSINVVINIADYSEDLLIGLMDYYEHVVLQEYSYEPYMYDIKHAIYSVLNSEYIGDNAFIQDFMKSHKDTTFNLTLVREFLICYYGYNKDLTQSDVGRLVFNSGIDFPKDNKYMYNLNNVNINYEDRILQFLKYCVPIFNLFTKDEILFACYRLSTGYILDKNKHSHSDVALCYKLIVLIQDYLTENKRFKNANVLVKDFVVDKHFDKSLRYINYFNLSHFDDDFKIFIESITCDSFYKIAYDVMDYGQHKHFPSLKVFKDYLKVKSSGALEVESRNEKYLINNIRSSKDLYVEKISLQDCSCVHSLGDYMVVLEGRSQYINYVLLQYVDQLIKTNNISSLKDFNITYKNAFNYDNWINYSSYSDYIVYSLTDNFGINDTIDILNIVGESDNILSVNQWYSLIKEHNEDKELPLSWLLELV